MGETVSHVLAPGHAAPRVDVPLCAELCVATAVLIALQAPVLIFINSIRGSVTPRYYSMWKEEANFRPGRAPGAKTTLHTKRRNLTRSRFSPSETTGV